VTEEEEASTSSCASTCFEDHVTVELGAQTVHDQVKVVEESREHSSEVLSLVEGDLGLLLDLDNINFHRAGVEVKSI